MRKFLRNIRDKVRGLGRINLALSVFTVLTVVLGVSFFVHAINVENGSSHIHKQPLSITLSEVKKAKKATWVNNEGVLMSSVGSRVGSDIPNAASDSALSNLTNQGVDITIKTSLSDLYPSSRASLYNKISGGLIALSIISSIVFFVRRYRSNNSAIEKEGEKAFSGGGANEAIIDYEEPDVTFDDVAGCDEAVSSLNEMADYLKYPDRYKKMGVRIPKGALLHGEPGNGKTLLARALAGEAKVPFFIANGSEFAEIYVGSGPKKVRELFGRVKKHKSAILFIDEVDAIARKRSSGPNEGNQETESTLNQLLTEIDGFNSKNSDNSIIVIAATNRKDLLDPAITRSGRLERHIEVPMPDRPGREKILKLHSKGKPLADDVNLTLIAWRTAGFSGADMETIINEAGLTAIRENCTRITQKHLDEAVADVAMGRARESAHVTENDKKITAWHESGHAVCAYLQKDHGDPVAVSVVPRGPAGGVTWMSSTDNIFMSKKQALAKIVTAMGGRIAEEMFMDGEYTQGPSSDLQQATNIAYTMVTKYGMSDVGLQTRDEGVSASNEKVTAEVEKILSSCYHEAKKLISSNEEFLRNIVEELLEDNIYYSDMERIGNRLGIEHERTMDYDPVTLTK